MYIERASFSKTHGVTPTQAKVSFEALCNIALGVDFGIDVGGSVWIGKVIDSHVHKGGSVGRVTEITCNDVREFLQSEMVFCQLNQIDHKTGKIYTILDNDFVDALVALDYITQAQADKEYGKWEFLREFAFWDIIYPQTVINVLCYLAGYDPPVYSAEARNILNSTETALNADIAGTLSATNNFFGIDWQMGEKCGSALAYIADLMGLQFTLVPGAYQLAFYKIGESSYGIQWQGIYAEETTQGEALQTQVDTGVWIMGERDVWEMKNVDLVPAWNQAWNRWALKQEQWVFENILRPAGLDLFGTTIGDLQTAGSVSVNYIYMDGTTERQGTYELDLSTLYDPGFTESGFFEDLSIHDYLERVVFKVYRIGIMDQFLSPDEFNGKDSDGNKVPVRFKPIHTPLLDDPSVPYHVYGTKVFKKSKRHTIKVSAPKMRHEKGHRLSDETGHITFDAPQYKLSDAAIAYSTANQGCLPPSDGQAPAPPTNIIADAPSMDVCFYGPVFREFFGADQSFVDTTTGQPITILPRIGNKKVPGLRRSKVVVDASMSDPTNEDTTIWGRAPGGRLTVQEYMTAVPEYVPDSNFELTAEIEATLVANALLNRPHIVNSGEEHFGGICGHEPDGEIRRVSVSIDGTHGITETVSYSNDYPSQFHEPDIELLRRMGVDAALKKADRLKRTELTAQYKQQNEADAKDELKGEGHDVTHQKRVIVHSHLEVGLVEAIVTLRGEVVPLQPVAQGGEFKTVATTDPVLVDGFKGAQGVALATTSNLPAQNEDGHYGRLNVVTSGQVPALVMGPCKAGDALCLAATAADKANWPTMGKYLKQGAGGGIVAMEDVATPGDGKPVMISVKVSGGGAVVTQCFKLTDVSPDDYVVGKTWDGTTLGDTAVNIAKPWLLRHAASRGAESYTYSDGQTRLETGSGKTEKVTQSYAVNDIIFAESGVVGGTGVSVGGAALAWLDQNVDGRGWCQTT